LRAIFFGIIGLAMLWLLLGVCTVKPTLKSKIPRRTMPAEQIDTMKIYKMADQMPLFRKCDPPTREKRENRSCSITAIHDYIAAHQKYFQECGCSIAGIIIAQLIIDKKGRVEDVTIKRSFGCERLDEHIIQLFKKMPTWETTGMQNEIPVKIQYHVPVKIGY
jgi:hypothetical protein